MPESRKLRVFLCHASQDKPAVRELYKRLEAEGWIDPWLDEEKLLPGQNWDIEIEKAVEGADVVIVCLSKHSVTKEGFIQSEMGFILDIARTKQEETIFVIPLRLDKCEVPRRLRIYQYVDYFPKANRTLAYKLLLESFKLRAVRLGIAITNPLEETPIISSSGHMSISQKLSRFPVKPFITGIMTLIILIFGGSYIFQNWPLGSVPIPTRLPPVVSSKDGMKLLYIPAGIFEMGGTGGESDELPIHNVHLDAYWIDQTEVTNVMYAKCVGVGACDFPDSTDSHTRDSYYGNSEYDDYPVIYVSWNDANAYCKWAGRRLPTEAEWEKAASWDEQNQTKLVYPWGNSIDCSVTNFWGKEGGCVGDTTIVGSYESGQSSYGAYDMAGNVWEWVSSLHKPYPYDPVDGREDVTVYGARMLRGGSWLFDKHLIRSADRGWIFPNHADNYIGFRCALSASE